MFPFNQCSTCYPAKLPYTYAHDTHNVLERVLNCAMYIPYENDPVNPIASFKQLGYLC